jgi:hypothetical protein
MTREERLQQIAKELFHSSQNDKMFKTNRDALKEEFFRLMEYDFKGRDYILPVKTIEVPDSFWNATKMTKEEFVTSRFPGWNVEHCEYNTALGKTVFVLKQNPHYIAGVVEVDVDGGTVRVAKEVAEYTPEIDWATLAQERPDLFDRLAKPVTVLEIDEDEFEKLSEMEPEELATLQRHMRVKEPSLKVHPRLVKNGKTQQG